MKSNRRKKIILWICVSFLAILLLGAVVGHYLTRQYPLSVKFLGVELEAERFFYRIFPPSPDPERYSHVTADALERSMRSGADWLLSMQEPSGRFKYWYDPLEDQFSSMNDDNFLRQAGTSYSLTLVYEMTGDDRYLMAAIRSLNYLLRFKEQLDQNKAYFLFGGKAKLGGISLPMLTMLKIRELTGFAKYDEDLDKLTNMILFLQEKYQTGQYKSTYVYYDDYEYEKNSGWESRIYPGEALFALATMYRTIGDPRCKISMDWALEFYSHKKQWKKHSFLPWTISAYVSLYEQSPEQKYADYVLKLSKHLLTQQNLDSDDDVYGSFHILPAANTGSYMEGLADAVHLAQLTGDEGLSRLYQEHAKMGYRWLLLLQYAKDDQASVKRPELAIGGVRTNISNAQLRIDNTQHAISAFAKGLRFVFGKQPVVKKWNHGGSEE